jgi:sugar lactone lactonase YvrE
MSRRCAWIWCVVGITLAGVAWMPASAMRIEPYREGLAVELLVQGLDGPAGMAVDPQSGHLHVVEKTGRRVAMIQERMIETRVQSEFEVVRSVPVWAVLEDRGLADWTAGQFRDPVDIAFDAEGRLWVAEAGMRGRLLCFDRIEDQFGYARVIASPWLEESVGYTSVQVDRHGRVYTTMQRVDDPGLLTMGRVAMREPDGEWYLIDYGPFAEFSNVQLSTDDGTLVFAEHRTADLTWYDADRRMLYGAMERVRGIRHVVLMADGTTLASLRHEDGTWSVVEIDPRYGRVWEWVGDLTEIGGLAAHPGNGEVYVSLLAEGRVMRLCRQGERRAAPENRLAGMMQQFEIEHALPPKEWPAFFREFIERLGMVEAVNEVWSSLNPVDRSFSQVPMSVDEFTTAIPVVAAKLRATLLSPAEMEPDPIVELSFVIFFPNQTVHTRQSVAPSVSLFRAEHRSGRVVRTRFLPTANGFPLTEDLDWDDLPEVLVSLPAGYYANQTGVSEDGLVRTYFLGMGLGPDYWVDVHRGDPNRNVMRVEGRNGERIEYALEPYPERCEAGGESVLVAGLKDVEKGWLAIGKSPVWWNVALGDEAPVLPMRNMERTQRQAWQGLDMVPSLAERTAFNLSREQISFRRAVVLRAATRWPEAYF